MLAGVGNRATCLINALTEELAATGSSLASEMSNEFFDLAVENYFAVM